MEFNIEQPVNLKTGKPASNLTDKQWQLYFKNLKSKTKQSNQKIMSTQFVDTTINGQPLQSRYDGDTQYMYYCEFINSILEAIRGNDEEPPAHEYCYFVYQIEDLLKFEHENLRTRYLPEYKCFEVWLHF